MAMTAQFVEWEPNTTNCYTPPPNPKAGGHNRAGGYNRGGSLNERKTKASAGEGDGKVPPPRTNVTPPLPPEPKKYDPLSQDGTVISSENTVNRANEARKNLQAHVGLCGNCIAGGNWWLRALQNAESKRLQCEE